MTEPLVTIGVPVYNGATYLAEALSALTSQTYQNIEIVISDNASTDATEEICRAFAASDPRIRYDRLEENIGPARNFNRLVDLAGGEYFKWAAHDDLHAPTYLASCVAALQSTPDAVLCQTRVRIIDADGVPIQDLPGKRLTDAGAPNIRFRSVLFDNRCQQVFGLVRLDVLKHTQLIRPFAHGDGILLAELSTYGRFIEVPEYLFSYRDHPEQSVKIAQSSYRNYTAWFDPRKRGRISMPYWRRLAEYFGVALGAPLSISDRFQIALELIPLAKHLRMALWWDITTAGNTLLGRRAG